MSKQDRVRVRLGVAVNQGIGAFVQQLEERRLLSFDGGLAVDADPGDPAAGEAITLDAGVDLGADGGGDDAPIRTLGDASDDGEVPQEWLYMTMAPADGELPADGGDDAEQPVYKGDDGGVPAGDDGDVPVIYTMTPADGDDDRGGRRRRWRPRRRRWRRRGRRHRRGDRDPHARRRGRGPPEGQRRPGRPRHRRRRHDRRRTSADGARRSSSP